MRVHPRPQVQLQRPPSRRKRSAVAGVRVVVVVGETWVDKGMSQYNTTVDGRVIRKKKRNKIGEVEQLI